MNLVPSSIVIRIFLGYIFCIISVFRVALSAIVGDYWCTVTPRTTERLFDALGNSIWPCLTRGFCVGLTGTPYGPMLVPVAGSRPHSPPPSHPPTSDCPHIVHIVHIVNLVITNSLSLNISHESYCTATNFGIYSHYLSRDNTFYLRH